MFRTDEAILIAGRFDAYPTGAEFTLQLELREPEDERTFLPWEFHSRPPARDEDCQTNCYGWV
ncbi:MAG TPA: hypothetical protein VE487_09285 [Ilumatobacter sp.]|nr:hypothetical protein [Ilumatobacter sp.]